jgi:hypothetical protein
MSKNSLVLTSLFCGTVSSYLGSVVYGKNAFSQVGDILKRGPMIDHSQTLNTSNITNYRTQLINNEREVINNFETAFERRAEAIRITKEKKGKESNPAFPPSTAIDFDRDFRSNSEKSDPYWKP